MGRWRQLSILIVEDDPVFALEMTYAVEDAGHRVVRHESRFADAIEAAHRLKPDVAFVDLNLYEGLIGPTLARRFAREGRPLVIFVTGHPEHLPPDLAGAYGVLRKPVSPADLKATLAFLAAKLDGGEGPKPNQLRLAAE
jgi:CheY-like chemotaxis protein